MNGLVVFVHLIILCACVYAIQFYLAKLFNYGELIKILYLNEFRFISISVKNYFQSRYGVGGNNNNGDCENAAGSANQQMQPRIMSTSPHPQFQGASYLSPNPPPYSVNVLPYPQQNSQMLTPTTSPYPHHMGFYVASPAAQSIYQTPSPIPVVVPVQVQDEKKEEEAEKSEELLSGGKSKNCITKE